MSRIYRTASGRNIDLDQLILGNENTIAVGNMNVNAAGDELGPGGQVVASRNQSMDNYYNLNSNKAVDDFAIAQKEKQKHAHSVLIPENKDALLADEDPNFEPPTSTPPPSRRQGLRGNLADSVAKQTVIDQPEITPPGTTRGPKRI